LELNSVRRKNPTEDAVIIDWGRGAFQGKDNSGLMLKLKIQSKVRR